MFASALEVKTIGVDLSWLLSAIVHRNSATALSFDEAAANAYFVQKLFDKITTFTNAGLRVILIADGVRRQPTKIATLIRARERAKKLHAARAAQLAGDVAKASALLAQSVHVTPSMFEAVEAQCQSLELVSFFRAPFEFDHQATFMLRDGYFMTNIRFISKQFFNDGFPLCCVNIP